jgi:putative oxidoreductase
MSSLRSADVRGHVSHGSSFSLESIEQGVDARKDAIALLARISLAAMFVLSGYGKIVGFEGTAGYIAHYGLPFPQLLAAIAIVIELGAGLAILAGWRTRWAALAFVALLVVITPIFHNFWSVPADQAMEQQINFMKNSSILGGMLLLLAFGPGRYSVDRRERSST